MADDPNMIYQQTQSGLETAAVRVQKRAVQDNQQISDTVRHEEVRVENEGAVDLQDKTRPDERSLQRRYFCCSLGVKRKMLHPLRRGIFLPLSGHSRLFSY
jgi:hypothetical protein